MCRCAGLVAAGMVLGDRKKIRILFLAASPRDDDELDLMRNVSLIQQTIRTSPDRKRLEFRQEWAVTIDTLTQALLEVRPAIAHFAGHGTPEGIVLEDGSGGGRIVPGEALAELFGRFSDVLHCVVLSSCHSIHQAKAIRTSIPHVIAMRGRIADYAAAAFSIGFYQALGARMEIPEAYDFGLDRIRLERAPGADVPILL